MTSGVFASHSLELPEASPEPKLYCELEAEERQHADLLSNALLRFREGKPLLI